MDRACLLFSLVLTLLFSSAVFAIDLPSDIETSLPVVPTQLTAGKKLGMFRLRLSVRVKFAQGTAFPVTAAITDFAHHIVFAFIIPDNNLTWLMCELAPGDYDVTYRAIGKRSVLYEGVLRPLTNFSIGETGRLGYSADMGYPQLILRKIQIISPKPGEKIGGTVVRFRWKPIPGVSTYSVATAPINVLHQEGTEDAEVRHVQVVHRPELDAPAKEFFDPDEPYPGYYWLVEDGDENSGQGDCARVATGGSYFLTGKPDRFSDPSYPWNEWIDYRNSVRFIQPNVVADELGELISQRLARIRRSRAPG